MTRTLKHYPILAELFRYPDPEYTISVAAAQHLLDREFPEAAEQLQPFTQFVQDAALTTLEELYTRSFDVQAITTLDLGYVLFGDDYKRGAVLVHLSEEHKEAGTSLGNELADHLPYVLRLLPLMKDEALRDELVEFIVGPAVRKIVREFNPGHIEKKRKVYEKHHKTWIDRPENYGTIYRRPLEALYAVLQTDFSVGEEAPAGPASDFLRNIDQKIALETDK